MPKLAFATHASIFPMYQRQAAMQGASGRHYYFITRIMMERRRMPYPMPQHYLRNAPAIIFYRFSATGKIAGVVTMGDERYHLHYISFLDYH